MLYLNPDTVKIKKAKKLHLDKIVDLIYYRIDKITNLYSQRLFDNFINDHLETILIGEPSNIIALSNRINSVIGTNVNLIRDIKKVFNYKWFIDKTTSRYSGYDLAQALDISTCTYCNRNYTTTVISKKGKKIIRPQFDHYFDKDSHPLLSLSFYNLIPCCSICNSSIKNQIEFNLVTHTHPYIDEILNDFKFSYSLKGDPYYKSGLKIDVNINSNVRVQNYINNLKIEEVYNSHTDILFDLIKIKQTYSDRYLSILEDNLLDGFKLSKKEIYRLAFGVYMDNKDLDKRPFSKFKRDILLELNMIS